MRRKISNFTTEVEQELWDEGECGTRTAEGSTMPIGKRGALGPAASLVATAEGSTTPRGRRGALGPVASLVARVREVPGRDRVREVSGDLDREVSAVSPLRSIVLRFFSSSFVRYSNRVDLSRCTL